MMMWNEVVEVCEEFRSWPTHRSSTAVSGRVSSSSRFSHGWRAPASQHLAWLRRTRQQEAIARLQPISTPLRSRHRDNPKRLAEETRLLIAREGLSPFFDVGCLGALAQFPVFDHVVLQHRQAPLWGTFPVGSDLRRDPPTG